MIDDSKTGGRPDPLFRNVGTGLAIIRKCMGCDLSRITLGGRGVGVRWRCAGCVARRAAA